MTIMLRRLMKDKEAAAYLGISETKLRGLNIPRRVMGGNKLYDRLDLDDFAADLPYENGEAPNGGW